MKIKHVMTLAASFLISGCSSLGMPASVKPVQGFELNSYLGTWYEVARLDHSFERGLEQVTATYSMREDGGVKVINRGFSTKDNEWDEAEGKAYFVESSEQGYLKVSFFGPFYGSYVVFDTDPTHQEYAFVSGPDTSYLWLLSRTPEISDELKSKFTSQAESLGFDVDQLIWVNQKAPQVKIGSPN
ncbi:lipocalin family protein [Marinicella rhabdoformis]|uniref:lipocalin family protein n=1 Tax=Marinicella rhabdoformis TaxID=2580566 RepID=UPI0012AEC2BD|nr:lipocalin family protein [Marinicella rhabdoformis]